MADKKERQVEGRLQKIVKDHPIAASIISKLNTSPEIANVVTHLNSLPIVSMSTYDKIKSNKDIIDLFPDTELCIQILVSSILSPNDLVTPALSYTADDIKLPPSVKNTLLDIIKQHIDTNYNLTNNLPTILREALFTKGAYIEAIIPEASVDDIVSQYDVNNTNITTMDTDIANIIESKELGILGNINSKAFKYNSYTNSVMSTGNYTLDEDLKLSITAIGNSTLRKDSTIRVTEDDLFVSITDNPNVLLIKDIKKDIIHKNTKNKIKNMYKLSLDEENVKKEEELALDKIFKQSGTYTHKDSINVSTREEASRESIGKPLIIKLPVESVIPVHITNDSSNHLGYFVLLNDNGVPISGEDLGGEIDNSFANSAGYSPDKSISDTLISKARNGLFGMVKEDIKLKNVEEVYCKILEDMVKKKLKNSSYGELADMKDTYEIYRIMFHRALKSQRTKLLFLPAELVVFYAFEYRDNGTGRSLLEKSSILHSVRAILLFSKVMGQLKRSVDITKYTITLPENTQDPQGDMERTKSELLKSFMLTLPIGMSKTTDLVDWIHRLGMVINFKHPALPDMEVDIQTMGRDYIAPEDDLSDFLQEQTIMSYGLTPETVKASFSPDFATTVAANNLLTAKRTSDLQRVVNALTTEHVRKILNNDMHIINILKDVIGKNLKEIKTFITKDKNNESLKELSSLSKDNLINYIINTLCNVIKTNLPKVETTEAQTMNKAFEEYKNVIEPALDILFSSEALSNELVGNLADKVENLKAIFKTVLLKKWFNDNNYLPEVSDFFSRDDDGKPIFNVLEEHLTHVDMLKETLLPILKDFKKFKEKTDEDIEEIDNGESSDNNDNTDNQQDNTQQDNNQQEQPQDGQQDQQQQEDNNQQQDGNNDGFPEDPFADSNDPFADNNGGVDNNDNQAPEPADTNNMPQQQQQDNTQQDNNQQDQQPQQEDNKEDQNNNQQQ